MPQLTVELLHPMTPQFISPNMWAASSPHLNPVDYRIWDMIRSLCIEYQFAIWRSCGSGLLRWVKFQQSMVDYAIDQWRKRLEGCVHAEDGHFAHLL